MTARLLDVDVSEESAGQTTPTPYERRLLSDVVALAERVGRPVRLLIVPTRNVVDAIVGTVIRLRSSDVYVGESSTLSAEDQARLLGDAWERADKPEALDVRLVIYHRSGRADTYHLGAHPPSLTSGDLDSDSPAVARRRQDRRSTRASRRRRQSSAETNGTTTHRSPTRRGGRGDSGRGAARRRARGGASRPRLRAAARHAPQPACRRRRDAPHGAQPRRPGGRLPRHAAQGCRGGVRVPLAGGEGSPAEGDGARGRRGAAEQHGAGRPHVVPRGTAGRSHAPAAGAAHADRNAPSR